MAAGGATLNRPQRGGASVSISVNDVIMLQSSRGVCGPNNTFGTCDPFATVAAACRADETPGRDIRVSKYQVASETARLAGFGFTLGFG
jgi:hypothetical protein